MSSVGRFPVVSAVTLALLTMSLWLFGESALYGTNACAWIMVLEGTTRLLRSTSKGKAREYERFLIHIPSRMAADSQFPFKPGQELTITVDPRGEIVLSG